MPVDAYGMFMGAIFLMSHKKAVHGLFTPWKAKGWFLLSLQIGKLRRDSIAE